MKFISVAESQDREQGTFLSLGCTKGCLTLHLEHTTETLLEELLYRAPACPLAPFLVIANVIITKLFPKSTCHREGQAAKVTHRACTLTAFPPCREITSSHTGDGHGKDSLDARQVKGSTAVPMAQLAQVKYRCAAQWHGMG